MRLRSNTNEGSSVIESADGYDQAASGALAGRKTAAPNQAERPGKRVGMEVVRQHWQSKRAVGLRGWAVGRR